MKKADAKPRVKIYTRTGCPYCKTALDILKYRDIPYEEINIYGRTRRNCGTRSLESQADEAMCRRF